MTVLKYYWYYLTILIQWPVMLLPVIYSVIWPQCNAMILVNNTDDAIQYVSLPADPIRDIVAVYNDIYKYDKCNINASNAPCDYSDRNSWSNYSYTIWRKCPKYSNDIGKWPINAGWYSHICLAYTMACYIQPTIPLFYDIVWYRDEAYSIQLSSYQ